LKPYLYNDGKGKQIRIKDLVEKRKQSRMKAKKEQQYIKSMLCCSSSSVHPSCIEDKSKGSFIRSRTAWRRGHLDAGYVLAWGTSWHQNVISNKNLFLQLHYLKSSIWR